ncbi:MAG: ABC transporter permease [Rhodocyclaceae bacterium]|jgi:arginine/ornithine transport system permease protein|nr:ABC transporter permease [Rhodocyclaceae bacterium]MBK6907308.1 ABC transporter permease [Rhodocyclaceae bacterium]
MFEFEIITENFSSYLDGMWLTAQLVGIALAAGLVMAVPLAVMRVSNNPFLYRPVWLYTYFFRGTPMLIQLLVVYYGLAQFQWMQDAWEAQSPFWLLFREPFFCALLAFAVNTCAYTVEILAGSIRSIPHGEIEAAQAMGMTPFTRLRRITLPSALRRSIPAYSNEVIFMLQGSAIASAVTLVDITGAARDVYSRHFAPFEAFVFAGLIYLLMTFAIVGLFRLAEQRWLAHLMPRKTQAAH